MVEAPSPPTILSPNHYEGGNKPIRFIVVHCTVSPCDPGEARDIAQYFQDPSVEASAHYNTDPGETIQCVWDSDRAWHAGSEGSEHSLGLELCSYVDDVDWGDSSHEAMLARAADLVNQLCRAYDIPMDRIGPDELAGGASGICGHVDVRDGLGGTTHYDPGEAFPWDHFMRMVRDEEDNVGHVDSISNEAADKIATRVLTSDVVKTPWEDDENVTWTVKNALQGIWRSAQRAEKQATEDQVVRSAAERQEVRQIGKQVKQLSQQLGTPEVDEQAVVQGLLEELTPDAIATAVADAMPGYELVPKKD